MGRNWAIAVGINKYKYLPNLKYAVRDAELMKDWFENEAGFEKVYFMMGSPEGEGYDREQPQHKVTVSSFHMGKYPITQAQWQAVMGNNPACFKNNPLNPVEQVSWDDAQEFCRKLSEKTGKKYKLPTEAEWEYACRGGTQTKYAFGEELTKQQANFNRNINKTTPLGSYPPNDFGLWDMHGNVWEWCEDDWHDNYDGAPDRGDAWLSENSNKKVVRGGSWDLDPFYCRSAYRSNDSRGLRFNDIGFRVVCVAGRTT